MSVIDLTSRYPVANVPYRPAYSVPVTKIVIHYLDFGDLPETATRAQEIRVMDSVYGFHVNVRHWGGVGYHGIAFRSGRAYLTADWSRWGAHTYAENDDSRGFAVAGEWANTVPPESLQRSVAQLVERHDGLYGALRRLYGHQDFVRTTCPGNRYREWVPQLRGLITPPEEDGMNEQEVLDIIQAYVKGEKDNFAQDVRSSDAAQDAMWEGVKKNVRSTATDRVSAHTENEPHGGSGNLTRADVKDEIDRASVKADRGA